jgi:hypothetical protein
MLDFGHFFFFFGIWIGVLEEFFFEPCESWDLSVD